MAITYVGGKTAGFVGSAATAITVALNSGLTGGSDAGVSTNDLVVVTVGYGTNGGSSNPSPTNPTGYTALTQQAITSGTYDTNHRVAYKFMGATPDTSVDIPPSGNGQWGGSYSIQVFRGVDTSTPLDVTSTYASGFNTNAKPNPAAITPVTSGAWIVVMGNASDPTGATFTTSDMTDFLTSLGSDNIDSMIGAGYYTGWTSGSFDPAIFGGGTTGSNLSWAATTLALRPASGGGSSPSASLSPSASVSPSSSVSASLSPSASISPSASVSPSASISASISPSSSTSPSSSASASLSPSASTSPSASVSSSISPSASVSPSSSSSSSQSPSASVSPSASLSASISPSASSSASLSPSASPSAGYTGYTREAKVALPTVTTDLATAYSGQDVTDVATSNDVRVGISGASQYLIHQYKNFMTSSGAVTFTCELQSTVAASTATVYLQIYNYNTPGWETLTSNNTTAANTDFTLQSTVANMTNYKSGGVAVCRVYQLAP